MKRDVERLRTDTTLVFAPTHLVNQNVVAMYGEPNSSSEMVSQATFGALAQVETTDGVFTRVTGEDRYSGWVFSRWLIEKPDTEDHLHTTIASLFADVHTGPAFDTPLKTRLTVGARVVLSRAAAKDSYVPLYLPDDSPAYTHRGNISLTYEEPPAIDLLGSMEQREGPVSLRLSVIESILAQLGPTARRLVGTPYLWGGTTPFGIDCSGFVQLVFRLNGIQLLRDSYQQIADRRFMTVDAESLQSMNLESGDLLFFADKAGKVAHVGLSLGDGEFIHAAGSGRGAQVSLCDDVDFAPTFIGARRISADADFSIEGA